MKKLLFLMLTSVAAPALAATFSVSGWTAQAGQPEHFTITRVTGTDPDYVSFRTNDGTAKAKVDYGPITGRVYFKRGEPSRTITRPTYINSAQLGQTLTFRGTISVNGVVQSSATAFIVEPPIPAPAATPSPTPQPTQKCPDGSVILEASICPVAAPPPPAPTAVADPPGSFNNPLVGTAPGVGAPDIATTDHNVMDDLIGGQAIPPSAAPDYVGAFRFICWHTATKADDPLFAYGVPGGSHFHDQTGVFNWSAFSNYGNLRVSGGGSHCNDVEAADRDPTKHDHAANRTPYDQPALLDGRGNVINVDDIAIYYKRRPATDPIVSDPTNPRYMGKAVPLPNGIKFRFGNFPEDPSKPFDNAHTKFMCTGPGVSLEYGGDMLSALRVCQGTVNQFEVRSEAPDCWDGKNLDSADHRSHVSYSGYGSWGYLKCDAAHPYVIWQYTYGAQYTIAATDDVTKIRFSSDDVCMALGKGQGCSFHVGYGPAAWDPIVRRMIEDYCINKMLNCSGGDLGNGYRLKDAGPPTYLLNGQYVTSWKNPQRLTPLPQTMVMP